MVCFCPPASYLFEMLAPKPHPARASHHAAFPSFPLPCPLMRYRSCTAGPWWRRPGAACWGCATACCPTSTPPSTTPARRGRQSCARSSSTSPTTAPRTATAGGWRASGLGIVGVAQRCCRCCSKKPAVRAAWWHCSNNLSLLTLLLVQFFYGLPCWLLLPLQAVHGGRRAAGDAGAGAGRFAGAALISLFGADYSACACVLLCAGQCVCQPPTALQIFFTPERRPLTAGARLLPSRPVALPLGQGRARHQVRAWVSEAECVAGCWAMDLAAEACASAVHGHYITPPTLLLHALQ